MIAKEFPLLEETFKDFDIQVIRNKDVGNLTRINVNGKTIEVGHLFMILHPILQELIIWQMIEIHAQQGTTIDKLIIADSVSAKKIIERYGDDCKSLILKFHQYSASSLFVNDMEGRRLKNIVNIL